MDICESDDCDNKSFRYGLCDKHYRKSDKRNSYKKRKVTPPEERFWRYVNKLSDKECWNWTGGTARGYGAFSEHNRKQIMAPRYSYKMHYGAFNEELCVLHKCDNPLCVNPDHLFLGTLADNNRDAKEKGRNAIGETPGNSKLKAEDIFAIRGDDRLLRIVAKEYGVREGQISRIKNRQGWGHI